MLKFIAVRHGDANEVSFFNKKKNLSTLGIRQIKKLAKLLKDNDLFPNAIYTSPKLRAVETSNILKEVLAGHIFEETALCEPFDNEKLLEILVESSDDKSIIFFVGHAPSLAEFVSNLIGKNVLENGLQKGCAVLIAFHDSIEFGKGTFQKLFNQ